MFLSDILALSSPSRAGECAGWRLDAWRLGRRKSKGSSEDLFLVFSARENVLPSPPQLLLHTMKFFCEEKELIRSVQKHP